MNTELLMSQRRRSPSVILPDDLVIEIISWLNVKSLMKMKCVSKSWNTLISDPKFVKMHLNRSSQNSHSYLVQNNDDYSFVPFSVNNSKQKDDYSFIPCSVNDLLENCSIDLPNDPYYSLIDKDCRKVVGSCNGLVCLLGYSLVKEDYRFQDMWLRLWNPSTRTISGKLGYFRDSIYWKFTFAYDNSTDTYKVVALHLSRDDITITMEVRVLSFGDNVWRNIQSFRVILAMLCYPHTRDYRDDGGVHLDSTVNWLAITKNGNLPQFVIISLDLGTEIHTQLLSPPLSLSRKAHLTTGVCVLMDTLCYYQDIKQIEFVIWKMTKFGDEKSWTQLLKLDNHNFPMKITRGLSCINLHENGDILVFTDYQQNRAILYNWRNGSIVKTSVNKEICWSSINNYVESLVSVC